MTADSEVALPTAGALTFLFTDIEGSTRKAHELGDDWFAVLETHHALLRPIFTARGGHEVSTAGDSFFVVFEDAAAAVDATVAMQHALAEHDWAPHPQVKVRMGLHTGPARFRAEDNDYAGLTVHAASRVESAAAGAQVLITQATLDAARDAFPGGVDTLDLGLHRLKDLPAELHLYQIVAAGLEREFPPVRGLDVVRNNVPVPPSSFVGRTEVLTRLHRMLDDDRLVTITGSGGTGKTRVALRVASERLHRHAEGVWFVELAGALDGNGVVNAFAHALGVREEGDRGLLETVADGLRAQNVLLVVDNCEHVIDDAAKVIERLLGTGAGVRVLATSREPLELEGERPWPLAPLSIDGADGAAGEAVALLVDRIALVVPDFAPTDDDLALAATIAQRLDGLPLALELAAASAAELSVAEIAGQLDDRFALLTHGKRTAADRQKTLRGAIEWSYGLLNDAEQQIFRRLAVFPAEFDFGVARAVCGEAALDFDDTLAALTRKSLVAESASTRLRYLESIRVYAGEQLDASGERSELAERHARYFVDGIDEDQMARAEWIDTVHEDLAAALHWGGKHDRELQLRALIQLQPFWMRRGRLSEARATSDTVLADTADLATHARVNALGNTGSIALSQGNTAAARPYFEGAGELAERVDSADAEIVLGDLGEIAAREGDFATAEALYERALDAARQANNDRAVALCLSHLSQVASQRGDLDRAWARGLEGLDAARALDWDELDFSLTNILGVIAHQRGDLAEARRILADAVAMGRKWDNTESLVYLLFYLGQVEFDDGQRAAAARYLREAIALGAEIGADADLAESLEATARVAASDAPELAASLLATVDALRQQLDFARPPAEVAAYDALREQLADTVAPAMARDDAVQAALEFLAAT